MRATLIEERIVHIQCPSCSDASGLTVTHLLGQERQFGPWYCEHCGHSITGTTHDDGTVDIEVHTDILTKRWDLLMLPPQDAPLYFVVEGINITYADGSDFLDSKRYHYESGTCPTNWLCKVVEILDQSGIDPHGLWKFVKSIPHTSEGYLYDTTWEEMFQMEFY